MATLRRAQLGVGREGVIRTGKTLRRAGSWRTVASCSFSIKIYKILRGKAAHNNDREKTVFIIYHRRYLWSLRVDEIWTVSWHGSLPADAIWIPAKFQIYHVTLLRILQCWKNRVETILEKSGVCKWTVIAYAHKYANSICVARFDF